MPRNFSITDDGRHVIFLRSKGPTDPINCLWQTEAATGIEQLLVDPHELRLDHEPRLGKEHDDGSAVAAAELARRERARESAGGIVAYSTDLSGRVLTFVLGDGLFVVDATSLDASEHINGETKDVAVRRIELSELGEPEAGVFDPRLSPDARYVSFVVENSLWVAPVDGQTPGWQLLPPVNTQERSLQESSAQEREADVSWGSAEFIAAEEMGRSRGHWWSPDNDALAVARVDVSPVLQWHIADPANPGKPPRIIRYPAAGTANAQVELYVMNVMGVMEKPRKEAPLRIKWDTEDFPYLCDVDWSADFGLTVVVQSRDQRKMRTLSADLDTGETVAVATTTDPDWVEIVPGAPAHSPFGLLTISDHYGTGEHHSANSHDSTRAIALNGEPITSPGEWVRAIVDVSWPDTHGYKPDGASQEIPQEITIVYLASTTPADVVLYSVIIVADDLAAASKNSSEPIASYRTELSRPNGAVATTAAAKAGTCVVGEASLEKPTTFKLRNDQRINQMITSYGADPFEALGYASATTNSTCNSSYNSTSNPISPGSATPGPRKRSPVGPWKVEMCAAGGLEVPTAILWPQQPTDKPLPILLDPYGGPGAQRVLNARNAYAQSQWFANQGYCVVIADGRGTPGRGGNWCKAIKGDLAKHALEDQLTALEYVVGKHSEEVDPNAVAIRGWSFGGYLAALAVLRQPDHFHAAIAGAPVTDWALYDTHYTERYIGDPKRNPDSYRRSSLLEDRPKIQRPIMLIHGLADDNVVAAHTLQLSSALLAAGHPHEVLPLTGVTHMTPQPIVAENLLLAQSDFLRRQLAL